MNRTIAAVVFYLIAVTSQAQVVNLDIKVFLEGPFFNDHMTTDLKDEGYLPLAQPYTASPWNYQGDESVSSIPSAVIVDWILIDILKKPADSTQDNFELYVRKAGFLLSDGSVTGLSGSGPLSIDLPNLIEFHVGVHHRNHLSVISSVAVSESNGQYSYDFTIGASQAVGGESVQKQMSAGIWSMLAADGNASNQIDNRDKNSVWFEQNGGTGYLAGDYDLNTVADVNDITNKWALNVGYGRSNTRGILKVCDDNGRYFCNGNKAVFLTGSHTWDNLQDIGTVAFDYEDYLDWMIMFNHNFIRLWAWETPHGTDWAVNTDNDISPLPYQKVGTAYDVSSLNQAYFDRLSQRIQAAQERGIYVAIMFFEGFSAEHTPVAWQHHPFKAGNNINGISVDRYDVHTNLNPDVVQAQRLYVREVIDIVNYHNLNNVLYEIGNEIPYTPDSDTWQNDMIDFIHNYELSTYGVNRPVGKTFQNDGGNNAALFNSPADWISPNSNGGYDCRDGDAPVATGDKVIISDTDHYYYFYYVNGGHPVDFVWKSFTGGINPIHMDNWGGGDNIAGRLHGPTGPTVFNFVRYNMGWARELADRLHLVAMLPQPSLSTTGFCLASDTEVVVYIPADFNSANVDMSGLSGQFTVEWFNPETGDTTYGTNVTGGASQNFISPYGNYSVLYLKQIN